MKLVTVSNTAPDYIIELLEKVGIDLSDITTLKSRVKLNSRCREKVLFIFDYADYRSNYKVLNLPSFEDKIVILFCTTLDAMRIDNCQYLDIDMRGSRCIAVRPDETRLLNVLTVDSATPKRVRNCEPIELFIGSPTRSVLTPLMTLLYGLKAETRQLAQDAIYGWLFSDTVSKSRVLYTRLYNINDPKVTPKFLRKVIDIFSTSAGKDFRKATRRVSRLSKAKLSQSDFIKAAKLYGVDSYELNYVGNAHFRLNLRQGKKSLSTIYHGKQRTNHAALPKRQAGLA